MRKHTIRNQGVALFATLCLATGLATALPAVASEPAEESAGLDGPQAEAIEEALSPERLDPEDLAPEAELEAAVGPETTEELLEIAENALATTPEAPELGQPLAANSPERPDLTLVLRDLAARMDSLTPGQKKRVNTLLARPTKPNRSDKYLGANYAGAKSKVRCGKHACVHWATKGRHAPPAKDKNRNKVPDWVETTLKTVNQVWKAEVTKAGFRAPRKDGSSKHKGPNNKLDVYLADVGKGGFYGYCTSDDPKRGKSRTISAYCVVDDDMAKSQFRAKPIKSLRVTVAHEFFHAVQFAYDWREDNWLLEGTATWMEEQVYDAINDNRQYIKGPGPITRPYIPMDYVNLDVSRPQYYHPTYATWTFFQYLGERLPKKKGGVPTITREIWNQAAKKGVQSRSAVSKALTARGTSFATMFAKYSAANVVPVGKDGYSEGKHFPTAAPRVIPSQPGSCAAVPCSSSVDKFLPTEDNYYLPQLSSMSWRTQPNGQASATVTFTTNGAASALGVVTTVTAGGKVARYPISFTGSTGTSGSIPLSGVTAIYSTLANTSLRNDGLQATLNITAP